MKIEQNIIMAKAEINAAVNKVAEKYKLPPCIIELIVCGALSDIRGQAAIISAIEIENNKKNGDEVKND